MVIVDAGAYQGGKRVSGRLELAELQRWAATDGAFVWVGLRMPSHAEMASICEQLDLDVDIDEVLTPHRRPVVSRVDQVSILHLRTALYDDLSEQVSVGELTLLASANALVTVRHGHASPLSAARHELEHDGDLLDEGVTAAVVTVVRAVIESYRPALDGFEKDAVEVEREVLSESRQRPVRRLLNLSRQVRELHLAVEAMEEPLAELGRHRALGWTKQTRDELKSALTLVQRVVARTDSLMDLIQAANSANQAQVAAQQNDDMRKISAWVAIAAVPTMIAGIYGMNFDHMPELRSAWGYPLVLGLMLLACLAMYRSFRRRKWL